MSLLCSTFETFAVDNIGPEIGLAFARFFYISVGSVAMGVIMALLFALVRSHICPLLVDAGLLSYSVSAFRFLFCCIVVVAVATFQVLRVAAE